MSDVGLLNLNKYSSYFGFQNGSVSHTSEYVMSAMRADRRNFADLAGNDVQIDTPLEFALLSYYSEPVINIRPVQADTILPANNPKLADQKLGAAVLQEIQILRFLGNTAAVGRHEVMLKSITDRGNVTRAEVETFYRNGIGELISQIVDEKMAKRHPTNPAFVAEIKQILTNFLLNPTRENQDVLHRRNNYYVSMDGQRGINTAESFLDAIGEFNTTLMDTVIDPSRLVLR